MNLNSTCLALTVCIGLVGWNSSIARAERPDAWQQESTPTGTLSDGKDDASSTVDGKWDTHAGRGVVTISGNTITDKDGNVGKVKYGNGRVNIFWPDNTGEGNLHFDPKNPDVMKGQGKYGHKWTWHRVKD